MDAIEYTGVKEALQQIRDEAMRLEDEPYEFVSVRSIALKLGHKKLLPQILTAVADGGFDYCMDPDIPMTGAHEANGEYPDPNVCYWGPDQLRSRLDSLSNINLWINGKAKKVRAI
jgi:hypothetical protein